ncbi:MAG: hypothetical protein ACYS0G_12910 [Planctomycetota bacterium]|jgi:T5SS/PEP-CTERM-associated repeat protein
MSAQRTALLVSLTGLTLTLLAAPAPGQGIDRYWDGPQGGCFNVVEFWVDGFDLGIPGTEDTAIFDLASIYTVCFPQDQTTDRVLIRSGIVTFDLDGSTYTLLNPLSSTPSVVIGETEVDTASLEIIGGTLHGKFSDIGRLPGAFGTLSITGQTSRLLNDWQLRVGNQGAGLLEINGGATAANGSAFVAAGAGSFGDALVTGEGAVWDCAGTLAAGKDGFGGLTINDGALVVSNAGIIAQGLSSFGDVQVSGTGSAWVTTGTLDVGMSGFGTLSIRDGATVTNEVFATIGTFPDEPGDHEGGVGDVTVSGPGSTWTINGDLYVGFLNYGRWTLSDGGRVVVDGDLSRGPWLPVSETPQTIIELADSDDYETAAISVTGSANGFDPRVELINGFVPQVGDEFLIATADGSLGPFDFDLPALPSGITWQVLQDTQSVELRIGKIGDLDGDGVTGVRDLLILLANWGACPPEGDCPSDLDGDGLVGVSDLLILLVNWG